MVLVVRYWKTREFDGVSDALLIDEGNGRETFPDLNLPPLYVIRRQERIRGTTRRRHRVASGIDHEMLGGIAGADATHIADIVVQGRQNSMTPIAGRDGPLEPTAAQNVLDAKGNEGRVFAIVIQRITAADALYYQPGGFVEGVGHARLLVAIDSTVRLGEAST